MKEKYEDATYAQTKKDYRVGKIWPKMWRYIFTEHNWLADDVFKHWPEFMNWYFSMKLDECDPKDELDEAIMIEAINVFFIENNLTRKKKELITKIL